MESSFEGPGSLVAFSDGIFEDLGEKEILSFLNSELPGLKPEQIIAVLQSRFSNYDDMLALHFEF